ncbi:MAG: LPP20 family lipoprotein [Elusimicrobia bacterium]|nr:LPP20 family lipoprotein [Elusimicrobiota bacterium]
MGPDKRFIVLVALLLSSCATIPGWVKGPLSYEKRGYIYALGYCAPTHDRKDAEAYAKDNAVLELAKVLKVKVKQTVLDRIEKTGRTGRSEEHFVITTEQVVDNIITNAEPVSVWYDEKGKKGEKGSAFALYRIKKSLVNETAAEEVK